MPSKKLKNANDFGDILAAFNEPAAGETRAASGLGAAPRARSASGQELTRGNHPARPPFSAISFPWPSNATAPSRGFGPGPANAYAEETALGKAADHGELSRKARRAVPEEEAKPPEARRSKLLARLFKFYFSPGLPTTCIDIATVFDAPVFLPRHYPAKEARLRAVKLAVHAQTMAR
jgi:hypothetical protein